VDVTSAVGVTSADAAISAPAVITSVAVTPGVVLVSVMVPSGATLVVPGACSVVVNGELVVVGLDVFVSVHALRIKVHTIIVLARRLVFIPLLTPNDV
jgi:hypothetical protein